MPRDTGLPPRQSRAARGEAGRTGETEGRKPVAQADPFFNMLRVLGIHAGKPLDIADLHALLPRRREGATAKDFARAAERLGYRTKKYVAVARICARLFYA